MYGIDLSNVYSALNEGLLVLLTGLAGWALWQAKAWLAAHAKFLDAETQQKLTDALNAVLQRGIDFALKTVEAQEATVKPATDSKIVEIAANYAANHAPETLDKLGKSPVDVAEMVLARLPPPAVIADLTGATDPKPAPIPSQYLPPIGETS